MGLKFTISKEQQLQQKRICRCKVLQISYWKVQRK